MTFLFYYLLNFYIAALKFREQLRLCIYVSLTLLFFFSFFFFSPQGYFFDREDSGSPGISSQAQEEALANDTASLGLLPETKFHPIRTAWIAILQLILFVSTSVS